MMAPRQMSRKLTAQQFCIGTGYYYVNLLTQKSVHEQIPFGNILYLIYEKTIKIAVNFIKHLKHIVKVISRKMYQSLIIKIDICKFYPFPGKRIITQCRLTASSYTDYNLGLRAVQVYIIFLLTLTKV